MNRIEFQEIAEIRLRESKALLAAGFPEGAYYLAGYALECALKACIAKRTREHDFPEKSLVNESYTHNLKDLVRLALLRGELDRSIRSNPNMQISWTIAQGWTESSRYDRKTVSDAEALLQAVENQSGGLLPWVRQHW